MSNKKRSVLLRAPGLVVLLALLLATAGLVYAHWTTTLNVDGQIQTGNVGVAWFDAWTNDDGFGNINDAENVASSAYDAWGSDSSADPATPDGHDVTVDGITTPGRYDKDVARCWADANGGSNLQLWIDSAYPSYHCMFTALLGGSGNVPVRATAIDLVASKEYPGYCTDEQGTPYSDGATINWDEGGPFADANDNGQWDTGETRLWDCHINAALDVRPGPNEGNFAFGFPGGPDEIVGDISAGVRCGTQVDPVECWWVDPTGVRYDGPVAWDDNGNAFADWNEDGQPSVGEPGLTRECDLTQTAQTSGWLHVEQGASQDTNYRFNLSQEFVNWNEWSVDMCSIGSLVDQDGNPATDDLCVWDGNDCVPTP